MKKNSFQEISRPFFLLACFIGILPMVWKTLLFSQQRCTIIRRHSRLVSTIMAVFTTSILIPVVIGIDCTIAFAKKLLEYSQNEGTSMIAFIVYVSLNMSVTMVIFFITALKSNSIAQFIEQTTAYDSKFKLDNQTSVITFKFLVLCASWLVNLAAEVHASVQVFNFRGAGIATRKCFIIIEFGSLNWDEILLIIVPHHLLNLGYFMMIASFGIFTDAICDRLRQIRKSCLPCFEQLIQRCDGDMEKDGSSVNAEVVVMELEKYKFQEFSARLRGLKKLHELMERCLGLILLVITCSLVVQCVMIIYLNAVFFIRLQNSWEWGLLFKFAPMVCTGTLAIFKLLFLVQCGHHLETEVIKLQDAVNYADIVALSTHKDFKEIRHFQLVANKTRIQLTGLGCFVMNRRFLSTIVTPILTFVMVIAQFGMIDTTTRTARIAPEHELLN